jgi:DNA-binding beta-propeller fold protein YncE
MLGCGGAASNTPPSNNPPPCFTPQPGYIYLDRNAIFVANTGSSSISAFQSVDFPEYPGGGVCGSPFAMSAPPTALGGGTLFDMGLLVLGQPQKSISMYPVDYITSVLTGPRFTITTPLTPVAVAGWGGFFYVANAEGSVSAYEVSGNGTVVTQLAGSPYPAGSGPVAIAAANTPGFTGFLYVANSQSNNISAYRLDASTGVPTPLAGSPYPAGEGPASVAVDPAPGANILGVRVVVVPNTRSNNVSVFSVASDGTLTPVPGSPFPAGGAPSSAATGQVMPLGFAYVTIPELNDVVGYSIDDATGALTPLANSPFPAGTRPLSVAMAAGGNFVYVANSGSNSLSAFAVDPGTGALTPVSGSPFPVGQSPSAVLYFQVPQ